MLVISRKMDESITIGDNIVVTILAVEGDRVKIGIDAPRELIILRQEIFQAVKDQVKLQELLVEEGKSDALQQLRNLLASETETESEKELEEPLENQNPV